MKHVYVCLIIRSTTSLANVHAAQVVKVAYTETLNIHSGSQVLNQKAFISV